PAMEARKGGAIGNYPRGLEEKSLASVAPPALDGAADDALLVSGLAPQAGEARIGRCRPLLGFEVIETNADRDCNAFPAHDALAIAERRNCVEESPGTFRHCGADARLVAIVVEAH